MKSIQLLLLLFSTFAQFGFSQDIVNDSLKRVLINKLRSVQSDTARCKILAALSENPEDEDAGMYNDLLGNLSKSQMNLHKPGTSLFEFYEYTYSEYLFNKANRVFRKGSYHEALEYEMQCFQLRKKRVNTDGLALILNIIGRTKHYLGEPKSAIEYLNESLIIYRNLKDLASEATTLGTLAVVYDHAGDWESAIKSHRISYQLFIKMNMVENYSSVLMNIGAVYYKLGKIDSANFYCNKAMYYLRRANDPRTLSEGYNNFGLLYLKQNNFKMALAYIDSSRVLNEKRGDQFAIGYNCKNLGLLYFKMKDLKKAEMYTNKAKNEALKHGAKKLLSTSSMLLHRIYKATGNYKKALENYMLGIQLNDTLEAEENKKASVKSQLQYEYEKKTAADSVKAAEERKVVDAQLKQEKTQRFALYGGLGLVGIFALFMVNRFRVTNKQKKLIEEQKRLVEHQKHLVEEKQKEILDSIKYARRIQSALITSEFYISQSLKRIKTQ